MKISPSSRIAPLGAALLLIGLATLVPTGGAAPRFYWRFEASDLLVNLLLYLPLGVLLAREEVSVGTVMGFALLLSVLVELLQGTLIPGRRGSPMDVLANTLGAAFGVLLFRGFLSLQRTRSPTGFVLALITLLIPAACWSVSGFLLAPAPKQTEQWYGQWAHHFAETEPFRGTITAVQFLGREVPDDRLDSTSALRQAALRGPLSLDVALRSAGTTEGVTHLASVADGDNHAVVGVAQLGDDLLVYWRSRGNALGLRSPQFHFAGGARARPGELLTVHARVTRAAASAIVQGDSGSRSISWKLTAFTGWRNLIPTRDLSPRAQRLLNVVWTLGLAGYLVFALRVLRTLRPHSGR